jgi:hypothetical protein
MLFLASGTLIFVIHTRIYDFASIRLLSVIALCLFYLSKTLVFVKVRSEGQYLPWVLVIGHIFRVFSSLSPQAIHYRLFTTIVSFYSQFHIVLLAESMLHMCFHIVCMFCVPCLYAVMCLILVMCL